MKRTRFTAFSNVSGKAIRTQGAKHLSDDEEIIDNLDSLIKVLKRPSNQRNTRSLKALLNFVREIKFFKQLASDLSEDAVAQCCLYMTYEYFKQDQVSSIQFVFKQGDTGSKFYIVLEGKCTVYVKTDDGTGVRVPMEVATCGKGDAFGELALLNNQPRAASISCVWDCHFAVLEKNDYKRILAKVHEMKMTQKVEFLHTLPMFKNWKRGAIQKATFYFHEKQFLRKQVLIRAGDPASEVYLIKDGLVQVSKDMKVTTRQTHLASARSFTVHAELVLLGKGESIGHEEAVLGSTHSMTYTCHSAVQVLSISREVPLTQEFLKRIYSEESWNYIKGLAEAKGGLRRKWMNNLETLEHIKQEWSPALCDPPAVSEPPPVLRIMGIRIDERPRTSSPDGALLPPELRESPSVPRLYPFHGIRESDPCNAQDAIKSFRRLKSWDQIFARKTGESKPPSRCSSRPEIINIHTHRVKSRPSTRSSLSRSVAAGGLVLTSTQTPCLAINTVEIVRAEDHTEPPAALSSRRIVKSSHSQFRWKRVSSWDGFPPAV